MMLFRIKTAAKGRTHITENHTERLDRNLHRTYAYAFLSL